jgi:hypothetical protein
MTTCLSSISSSQAESTQVTLGLLSPHLHIQAHMVSMTIDACMRVIHIYLRDSLAYLTARIQYIYIYIYIYYISDSQSEVSVY